MAISKPVKLIVYACPVGVLGERLNQFFEESETRFGCNEAHEYVPHVTLTSFFYLKSRQDIYLLAESMHAILQSVDPPIYLMREMSLQKRPGGNIKITMNCAYLENFIKSLKLRFMDIAEINVKPSMSYHLSLAYGYQDGYFEALSKLACEMLPLAQVGTGAMADFKSLGAATEWEVRVYEPPSEAVKDKIKATSSVKVWNQVCENWTMHFRKPLGKVKE